GREYQLHHPQSECLQTSLIIPCFQSAFGNGKSDADDGPAAALGIAHRERSAVLFHNLVDNCKTKPGSLVAMRDIRLGQAVAVFFRQAAAIIDDLDDNLIGADDKIDL